MKKHAFLISLFSFLLYALSNYGGIRSPDGEVVFRTARSLFEEQSFAIKTDLSWQGFGLPKGVDGHRYSIFGPGQALVAAPLVGLSSLLSHWSPKMIVPASHYVNGQSIPDYFRRKKPEPSSEHKLRFYLSFFNSIVGALSVFLFWFVARRVSENEAGALMAQAVFAFSTLFWPYSGTFFSEPLATLFVLAALLCLLELKEKKSPKMCALIGLFLGVATTVHLSALLFLPFLVVYIVLVAKKKERFYHFTLALVGFILIMSLLAYFNYVRFGNPLETGRGVDVRDDYQYGRWVAPWQGLLGLMVSGGRGLFFFCPVIILGLLCWRQWYEKEPLLVNTLLAAIAFRLLFIASRSDWYGGFCLGPRYLLLIIPLLVLPLAFTFGRLFEERDKKLKFILLFLILCAWQQAYFCQGDVFFHLHAKKFQLFAARTRVTDNEFAGSWEFSPLTQLHRSRPAPFWQQGRDFSPLLRWFFLALGPSLIFGWIYVVNWKGGE